MIYNVKSEQGDVYRQTGSFFNVQGWPSVCRDENGTLYAVASSFRMKHVCPFGKTAMFISRDDGKTWTKPMIINDSYLDDRDAGILYLGNGRLLVTWFTLDCEKWQDDILGSATESEAPLLKGMIDSFSLLTGEQRRGGSYVMISEDYGVTWSERIRVPVSSPHGPALCSDGTLIYLGKVNFPCEDEDGTIMAYSSHDGGKSWERVGLCKKPDEYEWRNFHEPHAAELPDGTLFAVIRAEGGAFSGNSFCNLRMFSTRSSDGGKTWSEWEQLSVNGAPPHLLMHSSGALICTYCKRNSPVEQRALVSFDGGKTWEDEYIFAASPEPDAGYPASIELADGSILTVYYQSTLDKNTQQRDSAIKYAKWRIK